MTPPRGCAGVALSGALADRFAILSGPPLATASITEVDDLAAEVADELNEPLWWVDMSATLRWDLARTDSGALLFSINGVPALVADPAGASLHLGRHPAAVAAQLVAAVGAPALAAATGAFPVHGASATRDGAGATVIVGPSGAGKSSLLCALADAGWRPVAEDVTVCDLAEPGVMRAWPGPPWVRLTPGQTGPKHSDPLPDPTDKACWDLTGRLADGPATVRNVVLLAPPGGSEPRLDVLAPVDAIATLPPHLAWLSTQPRDAAAFSAAIALSRHTTVVRLQMPRAADWAEQAVELLSAL